MKITSKERLEKLSAFPIGEKNVAYADYFTGESYLAMLTGEKTNLGVANVTFAPAVKTFLESNDFSQKTIFPFATNGGWIGHTFKDIAASCKAEEKGVTIKKGLNLRFDGNAMRTPQSELNGWISAIAKEEF